MDFNKTRITTNSYFHIYNHSIDKLLLFYDDNDRIRFLSTLKYQFDGNAEILAYVLMNNHFHLLIKTADKIRSRFLSHTLNSYSQYYNHRYKRRGTIYDSKVNRVKIEDELYLKRLICYIHNNPVKSGICNKPNEYKWSSYNAIISTNHSNVKRNEVIKLFVYIKNFIYTNNVKFRNLL